MTLTPAEIVYTADRIHARSLVAGDVANAAAGMKRMGVDKADVDAWESLGAELVRRISVEPGK